MSNSKHRLKRKSLIWKQSKNFQKFGVRAYGRKITAISSINPQGKSADFRCDTGIVIRITNMQHVHNDDDIEKEHSYWYELARYTEFYDQEIDILSLALGLKMGYVLVDR